MRRWFQSFRRDDRAQDLVEYTLLIGFLALAAIGVLWQVGVTVQGPWETAQTTLDGAAAAPATTPANPPPSGGGSGGNGDHGGHGDHDGH